MEMCCSFPYSHLLSILCLIKSFPGTRAYYLEFFLDSLKTRPLAVHPFLPTRWAGQNSSAAGIYGCYFKNDKTWASESIEGPEMHMIASANGSFPEANGRRNLRQDRIPMQPVCLWLEDAREALLILTRLCLLIQSVDHTCEEDKRFSNKTFRYDYILNLRNGFCSAALLHLHQAAKCIFESIWHWHFPLLHWMLCFSDWNMSGEDHCRGIKTKKDTGLEDSGCLSFPHSISSRLNKKTFDFHFSILNS